MAKKLTHKCDVCNSWFWCGRACGRMPADAPFFPAEAQPDESGIVSIIVEGQPDGSVTYKYRDPEKRRAYMKEYMRKRRAKEAPDAT